MPKLWDATIDAHRHAVREAVLDATAALVAERGPASVTMSQVAETSGIGRATLYKYFPDVESILRAWHERQVGAHLRELSAVREQAGDARRALVTVLEAYAHICRRAQHGGDVAAALHRGPDVAHAHGQLRDLVAELLAEGARTGDVRADVPAPELAGYCLHALQAAGALTSQAALRRLVTVTLDGLRPPA
ncbi:TetR/AcrR family transcriptional regulator [Catellatospora sp. NPDC049609]|uniref:TetR/AcrR family transcriptional regulator n=1 Tax=Catellatospora sp. NPDC049609 TaxID=3155505 RepID=UPI003448E631